MSGEFIGPSFWHGRDINSCTRCKYLRCRLTKSGREPDYDYFCMHPTALSGQVKEAHFTSLLSKVKELLPDKVDYWLVKIAKEKADAAAKGEFISNDGNTPETPEWCPVINNKSQEAT